jgi:hypothetical protein
LGFPTALFGDSDVPLDPSVPQLEAAGVRVILWSEASATEDRLAKDLPLEALGALLNIAAAFKSTDSVTNGFSSKLGKPMPSNLDIHTWIGPDVTEAQLRSAFAEAAKSGEWFKRIDVAQAVGVVVIEYIDAIQGSDLEQKVRALGSWAYGE